MGWGERLALGKKNVSGRLVTSSHNSMDNQVSGWVGVVVGGGDRLGGWGGEKTWGRGGGENNRQTLPLLPEKTEQTKPTLEKHIPKILIIIKKYSRKTKSMPHKPFSYNKTQGQHLVTAGPSVFVSETAVSAILWKENR